jgi:hypothetical protein
MKLSELIKQAFGENYTRANERFFIARLHECDDLPPNAAQQARITELKAQLAATTEDRDHWKRWSSIESGTAKGMFNLAETYRAAIPVAYKMALEDAAGIALDHRPERPLQSRATADAICGATRALTPPDDLVEQATAKTKGQST